LIFFLSDNGGAGNNQSSNLPLKGYKGNKYEGGHRVAFFAHWPDQIESGIRFGGLTSSLDIYATAADVSGAELGSEIHLDGVSLLPYFIGDRKDDPHQEMYWRKEGMAASRDGDYKMIRVDSLGYRLYNLKSDLGEVDDLTKIKKDRLASMQDKMQHWEAGLIEPLWVESKEWNEVTWYIHKDLYENQKVRAQSPQELKRLKAVSKK